MIYELLSNFSLWTSVTAIVLAQVLKVPWNYFISQKWDWGWLLNSGGMPSSHTSAVTSLATSIGLIEGWNSTSFAIATIFAVITMYDATGVRRHAGIQAQVINQLAEDFTTLLHEIRQLKLNEKPLGKSRIKLKEILGHKPIEVFIGLWFGILIALGMYWLWF
ncbi:divergent PAP2 family protein [Thermoflavimicrobium daqui]|jgi:acid phosphatase family membrane protein YuiD|uniref:Divergent PAP2 family protein n=1 Tax=Thermoflavimicrobium daqui TaxID=2137476 RepID=A0A364K9J7_9BACL|nr:divergent PAP2 family protein [Thermoflavimicrobium daqui]RAL26971.1 hypothetical protein DL897_02720 [Thermoflavimicrobium daqui]